MSDMCIPRGLEFTCVDPATEPVNLANFDSASHSTLPLRLPHGNLGCPDTPLVRPDVPFGPACWTEGVSTRPDYEQFAYPMPGYVAPADSDIFFGRQNPRLCSPGSLLT